MKRRSTARSAEVPRMRGMRAVPRDRRDAAVAELIRRAQAAGNGPLAASGVEMAPENHNDVTRPGDRLNRGDA